MNITPQSILEFLNGVNAVDTARINMRIKQRRGTWNYDQVQSLDTLEHKIPSERKASEEMYIPTTRKQDGIPTARKQFGIGKSGTVNKPTLLKKFGINPKKKSTPISCNETPSATPVNAHEKSEKNEPADGTNEAKEEPVDGTNETNRTNLDDMLRAYFQTACLPRATDANVVKNEDVTFKRVEKMVMDRKNAKEQYILRLEKDRLEQEKNSILEKLKKENEDSVCDNIPIGDAGDNIPIGDACGNTPIGEPIKVTTDTATDAAAATVLNLIRAAQEERKKKLSARAMSK